MMTRRPRGFCGAGTWKGPRPAPLKLSLELEGFKHTGFSSRKNIGCPSCEARKLVVVLVVMVLRLSSSIFSSLATLDEANVVVLLPLPLRLPGCPALARLHCSIWSLESKLDR